jgi:hypothetical protein
MAEYPERVVNIEDPRNDWASFYTFQGIVAAELLGDTIMKVLDGSYVIGIRLRGVDAFALVCADDKPVFRIRTFSSFAAARRFMSSLVLRGVNAPMRVVKMGEDRGSVI